MIGMMYLVLTALLAMNVSKDILNAFVVVNTALNATNASFGDKNKKTMADFEAAKAKDAAKVQPYYERAQLAHKKADELIIHIDKLKKKLIMETDKKDEKAADTLIYKLQYVDAKDNYDVPTLLMGLDDPAAPKDGPNTAVELKKKVNTLREDLIKIFEDPKLFLPKDKEEMAGKLKTLNTPKIVISNEGTTEEWENANFYHLPLAAVITNLSKIQADIRNAEADVVTKLLAAVKGKDFTFDRLTAKVIAPSSYILAGDKYTADVLLVAFNSTQSPEILVGPVDTIKNQLIGEGTKIPVSGGMGRYETNTSAEGMQKWSGVIRVEKPGGGYETYPFMSEYMVAKPAAAVSPDAMNVFYIGVANPVTISAAGVAPENLAPSISGGTLSGSRGKYEVRVTGGKEATITVNAKQGTKNVPMGTFKFRIKSIPSPVATVNGKKGDDIMTKAELATISGVGALLENFDFNLKFDVISFDVEAVLNGVLVSESSSSNRLSPAQAKLLQSVRANGKVYFNNVKAKGPDGVPRKIPGCSFKVK